MIIGVLICIFLLTDGVEAFFMCLLAIWRSFVKGPFKSFTYFWFAQFPVSNLPSLTYPSRPLAKPWRDPRQSPWSPAPGGLAAQLAACTFFFFWHAMWHVGSYFPDQGIEPPPPGLEARCLNHWATWDVLGLFLPSSWEAPSLSPGLGLCFLDLIMSLF